MDLEGLETTLSRLVRELVPDTAVACELIPLVGDETEDAPTEENRPLGAKPIPKRPSRGNVISAASSAGPWDVALDVCLPLARLRNLNAEDLATELAARITQELGVETFPLRGYVNIRLPEETLIGDPVLSSPAVDYALRSSSRDGSTLSLPSHLILVPAPWKGASGMQYLRFAAFPIMQALTLAALEGAGERWQITVVSGDAEFPVKTSSDIAPLLSYFLQRALLLSKGAPVTDFAGPTVFEGPTVREQIAGIEDRAARSNVWWWAWEDYRDNEDLVRFLRSSILTSLDPAEPGRFAIGCPKRLLTHIADDERVESLQFNSDEQVTSFLLYAVSGSPGAEFVPSVLDAPSGATPDSDQIFRWARSILDRCLPFAALGPSAVARGTTTLTISASGIRLLSETAWSKSNPALAQLAREVLVGAKLMPRRIARAGSCGEVLSLGRSLKKLLAGTQRLLNFPEFHRALRTQDLEAQHIVSSIFRSVEGVLTVISGVKTVDGKSGR